MAHPIHPLHGTQEGLKCKNCGEYGLVHRDSGPDDVWQCLYCREKVNLGESAKSDGPSFWSLVLGALMIAALMMAF